MKIERNLTHWRYGLSVMNAATGPVDYYTWCRDLSVGINERNGRHVYVAVREGERGVECCVMASADDRWAGEKSDKSHRRA